MDKELKKFDSAIIEELEKTGGKLKAEGKEIPKELLESVTGGVEDYVSVFTCPRCCQRLWCHPVVNVGVRYYCKGCGYYYVLY